ncbi:MAG: ComEC/Rec2 family competence protein, partial [Crocinitomicaceae bacterium]
MNFFRHPFVFVTFALIFGILFRIETEFYLSVIMATLIVTITLVLFRKLITKLPAVVLLFFIMGFLLPQKISRNLLKEDQITAVLEITERKSTQKDWDQAVGMITHIREQGNYEPVNQKLLIYTNSEVIRRGMKLLAVFTPKEIRNSGNPGSFNAETYWMAKGIEYMGFVTDEDIRMLSFNESGFLDRYATITRSYVSDVFDELPSDQSGILKALLLGDKGDLSTEIRDQFANAGAMHLLAVSGLHIGIIAFILLFIFKQFPSVFSNLSAHISIVVLLWAYAFVTGLSPSVTRAVLMFSLLILSRLVRGQYEPINVLAFSAFIVIVINPLVIYDIGFQLSYLAVFGIFIFYDRLAELLSTDYKVVNWLWNGTAIGLSAQLATAPLKLYYFHQFPNYFVISNLGIMLLA